MKKNTFQPKKAYEKADEVLEKAVKIGNELKSLLRKAKEKFESADEKTKKKVVVGVMGAAAALIAIMGAKKIGKKFSKKDK